MPARRENRRRGRRARRTQRAMDHTNGTTVWQMVQGKPHSFERLVNTGELAKAPGDQGFATVFQLNQLNSFTDFTNLFDQYQISKIEVTFEMDIADGGLNSTTRWPRVIIAPDYNNQGAPLNEQEVANIAQSKQYQFSTSERRFTVVIRPMVASALFRSGISSAYEMKPSGWLDSALTDVPHYGIKYWISNYNTTSFGSSNIRMWHRYYLACRNVQ